MSITFIHGGDETVASYRYRAVIPARALGASLNDARADVWIIAKPDSSFSQLPTMAKEQGKTLVVDICDAHLRRPIYEQLIREADAVTACTPFLAQFIEEDFGRSVAVIPDPYELPERPPHVSGANLFWFGHPANFYSMYRFLPMMKSESLRLMSNEHTISGMNFIPWNLAAVQEQLAWADAILLPETAPFKSANRAVEAIRQGCFVIAEPHPSLEDIPGIWVGSLMEGIAWLKSHPTEANQRLIASQAYVQENYSPERVANAWKMQLTALKCNWAAAANDGPDGRVSILTPHLEPTSAPMCEPCPSTAGVSMS